MDYYFEIIINRFSTSINLSMYFSIVIPIVSIYGIFIAFKQFASNKTPKRYLGIQISDVFIKKSIFVQFLESFWFLIFYFLIIIWKPVIVFFNIQKSIINTIWYFISILLIIDIILSFYRFSKMVFKIESAYNDSNTIKSINKIFKNKYKNYEKNAIIYYDCAFELIDFYNEEKNSNNPGNKLLRSYLLLLREIITDHCYSLNIITSINNELEIVNTLITICSKERLSSSEFNEDLNLRNKTLMQYTNKNFEFYSSIWEANKTLFFAIDETCLKRIFFNYMYSIKEINGNNDYFHTTESIKKISSLSIEQIIQEELNKVLKKDLSVNKFIYEFYDNITCNYVVDNYVVKVILKFFVNIYESENYKRIVPFYKYGKCFDELKTIINLIPINSRLYLFFYFLFLYSEYDFRFNKGVLSVELLHLLTHDKFADTVINECDSADMDEIKNILDNSDISHRINKRIFAVFYELVNYCVIGEYKSVLTELNNLYNEHKDKNKICILYLLLIAVYGNGYNGSLYDDKNNLNMCKRIIDLHKELQSCDSMFKEYNIFFDNT